MKQNKSEIVYLYDGSFINLMSLIEILIRNNIKPLYIKNNRTYINNIIDECVNLKINNNDIIIKKIMKLSSKYIIKLIYYVFLSEDDNKELIIYYFILNTLKYGNNVIYIRKLKCVSEMLRLGKYVSGEAHRFKGFVRFKEQSNNILYSTIEPTNNVLPIISEHFLSRLNNECWIIEDKTRKIKSIHQKNSDKYYIVQNEDFVINGMKQSINESDIEELWKTFFKTIAIKERKNERCQMNFMPKKYWNNLLEMEDNYD